ncbi:hypothetical protein [Caenimonas aquaedulcis]|uniref:Uncharacterized protein n=1 Tax=Caenimonas aquaedulcis TaxID=2793270 RepID=A0A931H5F7_9BURK|nr:hypothetical protein [Caenimonas aquaedulcis]MBG9388888.1 hypothetical protein [Caenimonas aquaedulcis]
MIRFLPDTWRDAILRPIAMASPDGAVYVEIIAPDFRFVFLILLALMWLVLARGEQRRKSAPLVLLAFTAVAFVPWLTTTGNGRYFIPFLLIAGPLCIGMLQLIPLSRSFRLTLAAGMVLCQVFVIHEVSPWRYWGHVVWGEGEPFPVEVPADVAAQPATYVTLSSISYSLIAPRFHPQSRWVNISTQPGLADKSKEGLRTQALIAAPGPLKVIFPTVPGGQEGDRLDPQLGLAIDGLLARQGLSLEDAGKCRLMRSTGLAGMASSKLADEAAGRAGIHGFWLCTLARRASERSKDAPVLLPRAEEVFAKLERTCPRIFPPNETVSLRIPQGAVRGYPGSDFKLYVLDDGRVFYKYYRALNSVDLGRIDEVLAPGFKIDCNQVQGRSGLPWERTI